MIPVSIQKIFQKMTRNHADVFSSAWLNRVKMEEANNNLPSIKFVSDTSLSDAANVFLEIVPEELMGHVTVILSVRHNPMSHRLEAFPLFCYDNLLSILTHNKLITGYTLSSIDESDSFEFNGTRNRVIHIKNSSCSEKNAGVYLQLELIDGSVCVWSMSPEEVLSAQKSWCEQAFCDESVFGCKESFIKFIMLLRAIKMMPGLSLFKENADIYSLFKGVDELYRGLFDELKLEKKDRYARSIQQNSYCISNQPSLIEKKINEMKTVAQSKSVVVPIKVKHKIPEKKCDERGITVVSDFGVGGW